MLFFYNIIYSYSRYNHNFHTPLQRYITSWHTPAATLQLSSWPQLLTSWAPVSRSYFSSYEGLVPNNARQLLVDIPFVLHDAWQSIFTPPIATVCLQHNNARSLIHFTSYSQIYRLLSTGCYQGPGQSYFRWCFGWHFGSSMPRMDEGRRRTDKRQTMDKFRFHEPCWHIHAQLSSVKIVWG